MTRIPGAFLVRQTSFVHLKGRALRDATFPSPTSSCCSSLNSFPLDQGEPIHQSLSQLPLSLPLSSLLASSSATLATSASSTLTEAKTFEAVAPDTNILIGFGIVLILSIIASYVWAEQVVPISRTKLALSKKNGEVNQYLQELKQGSITTDTDTDIDTDTDTDTDTATDIDATNVTSMKMQMNDAGAKQDTAMQQNNIKPNVGDGRDLERWLFSDWLNDNKSAGGGRKKEPALPILKKAKWNSGDNPVVVTAAIMMVGIIIASVTERVGTNGM